MQRKYWLASGSIVGLLFGILLALCAEGYTEYAYICKDTGSRKGHKEWVFGTVSSEWNWDSPLERFIKKNYPDKFERDWVSYAGTGKNIFDESMSWGHGRAGPIGVLKQRYFDEWFVLPTDEEKLNAYEVFTKGDGDAIWKLVDNAFARIGAKRKETN